MGTSPVRRSQKRPEGFDVSTQWHAHIRKSCLLTLRKRLLATGSLGENLLALGNGLATESDTLLGVEDGTLPDEGLDATGTTVDLVEGDLVDDLGAMLPVNACQLECSIFLLLTCYAGAESTCPCFKLRTWPSVGQQ